MITYQSFSSAGTKRFGRGLAKKISAQGGKGGHGKKAVIIALNGELGAGKTTFTQGFAAGLGVRSKIQSPTFILMRNTKLISDKRQETGDKRQKRKPFENFIHIDAYRADTKDFLKLGFKEIASNPKNIILVEWADRLKKIIPKSAIWLKFGHGKKENERKISLIKNL